MTPSSGPVAPVRDAAGASREAGVGRLVHAGVTIVVVASLAAFLVWFGDDLRAAFDTLVERASVARVAAYLGYSVGVLALLGAAWLAASGEPRRLWRTFVWARLVRDAAADLLPFSQIGAIVISFRLVVRRGVVPAVVYASFVADLTTELVGQLFFTIFGAACLVGHLRSVDAGDAPVVEVAIALVAIAALAGAAATVRWTLPLASRLIGVALPRAAGLVDDTSARLADLYRRRGRIATAFVLNLVAWIVSAFGAWVGLRLLDVDVPALRVVALESLVFAVRSVAFAIPAGIGVQEAGYGVLAPLLGVPVEAAVLIALLKRVRDVAIGVPVLFAWQVGEARAWTRRA